MNALEQQGKVGPHVPVMPAEVLEHLISDPGGVYIDATVGGGGHSELIAKALTPTGQVIGLDRDAAAITRTRERLTVSGEDRVRLVQADYAELASIRRDLGESAIHGVLFDLGLSSLQLDDPTRGFGYRQPGPLDLRFDANEGETASQWIARSSESDIQRVLWEYGEEPRSRAIGRAIARRRESVPVATTSDLWTILSSTVGTRMPLLGRTAARVWQALRIQVNAELQSVPIGVRAAIELLAQGGRVVVIAYHSLEDRIVKDIFRESTTQCNCPPIYPQCMCGANPRGRLVNRRVLRPSESEIATNPRARSARMRVFEKDILKSERGAA